MPPKKLVIKKRPPAPAPAPAPAAAPAAAVRTPRAPPAPVTFAPSKVNQRSDKTKELSLTRARGHFLPKFIQAPRRRRLGEPRRVADKKPVSTTTKTGRPKRKATAKQLAALAKARQSRG